ncbi:helix-turn-helix transcriptional regulator [Haloferax prahovense]|uniref:helix-turn-helix transcriptional regulator n=1 Tax=Haloferax prahovense TaxID=381852 RepID=UPI003C73302F
MRSAALIVALLTIVSGVAVPAAATDMTAAGAHGVDAAVDNSGVDGFGSDPRSQTPTALGRAPLVTQQSSLERSPQTEISIRVRDDRSADWRIEMRYDLETRNETAAFEAFVQEYEQGATDVGPDAAFFQRVSQTAAEQTGRSMTVQNATTTGYVENGTGVLVLRFTWTNFAEQTDEGLRVGDAFSAADGGTWLSSLQSNQNLTIQTPPGYAVSDTDIPLENNAVVAEGPRTFESTEQLSVSYVSTGSDGAIPWTLVGGGAIIFLVLVAGVVLFARRRPADADTAGPSASTPARRQEPMPEPADELGTDEEGDDDGEAGEAPDDIDLDLLSDEERVELLLERSGGRMKQANIVKETGWSDAKVSQLLSAMADEGRVEKLRLGRENLISLPDEDEDEE